MDNEKEKFGMDEPEFRYEYDQEDENQQRTTAPVRQSAGFYDEFAAETVPMKPVTTAPADRVKANSGVGWFALVVAIASLFIWPIVLGPVAAAAGFVSYTMGARALGVWSIVIGLVAFVTTLAFQPTLF